MRKIWWKNIYVCKILIIFKHSKPVCFNEKHLGNPSLYSCLTDRCISGVGACLANPRIHSIGRRFQRLCRPLSERGHSAVFPKDCSRRPSLPVCIEGRDPRGIVEVVGQDSGVVIEPKKVVGAVDPPPLSLRELREPGREEPLRAWGFGKGQS